MNDATSDYGYKLAEAQDKMAEAMREALYGRKANGIAQIDGSLGYMENLLFEATDIKGAPDGISLATYVMERAMEGEPVAKELVERLIQAYAKANAIAAE